MALEPEHPHAHGHKTGLPWLDLVMGVSVVFISVMSLVVSVNHGRTMEKLVHENERMVAANTMPYLEFSGSELDEKTGQPRLSLNLKNGGVGPALIDWLDVRFKGRSLPPAAFFKACCVQGMVGRFPKGVVYSNVSNTVLPARETVELLVISAAAEPEVRQAAAAARQHLTARACYCSVLEECWLTDFGRGRPKRVPDCRVPADVKPW